MKICLKKIDKIIWISAVFIFLVSLCVTLLDPRFAGPLTQDAILKAQIEFGKKLYKEKNCHSCHGDNGDHPAGQDFPRLKGQSYAYISNQLRDITQGRRTNGLSTVMQNSVPQLTEDEIRALARYITR